jgi:hypothetical protein
MNPGDLTMAILRLDHQGLTRAEIAERLSISREIVGNRLYRVSKTQMLRLQDEIGRKRRRCLGHGGLFLSTGPGHRVCDACKNRAAWRLPAQLHAGVDIEDMVGRRGVKKGQGADSCQLSAVSRQP